MLDGLGQRYHRLPSELKRMSIVDLAFDAGCAVLGDARERELMKGNGAEPKSADTRRKEGREAAARAAVQLPEGSPLRARLEEMLSGG